MILILIYVNFTFRCYLYQGALIKNFNFSSIFFQNGSISTVSSQISKKSCSFSDPIQRFASFLKNRSCKDIIVMAGAGISTASGIPDFRSPGTGLYYNTKKYNVAKPTDVFDLKYFNRNPNPFLDIIRDFIKSEKQPNSIHKFCKTLESHGLLLRMYTQNIDGLEKKSGISSNKLVEAHGTLESASCCKCFAPHSPSWTEKMILAHKVPSCRRKGCSGYVKPDVVMFGEELPKKFYLYPKDFQKCDLLIIMGTSLNVEPFSELVDAVPRRCPRVLLNRDAVGPFADSRRKNDIFVPGDISKSLKQVIKLVGWSIGSSSDECSSSGSNASETEGKTWASTRKFREMAVEKNPKQLEAVSLPNSVIRKSSQHQLVNKMSLLSVESNKNAKSVSRRSVSAPIPKTESRPSEQTIPTEISGNSADSSSVGKSSEQSVSTVESSERSCSGKGTCVSPQSSDKERSARGDVKVLEQVKPAETTCVSTVESRVRSTSDKVTSLSPLSSDKERSTREVTKILEHVKPAETTCNKTQESDVVIPNFTPVGPRSQFQTDVGKPDMLTASKQINMNPHKIDGAPTTLQIIRGAMCQSAEPRAFQNNILPPNSNPGDHSQTQTQNGLPTSPNQVNGDLTTGSSSDRDVVDEAPDCCNDNAKDELLLMKLNKLSNHNSLSERKSAPPATQCSDLRYPFSSAAKRVNRKPIQAKPLYSQRKFAQLREANSTFSRTPKTKTKRINRRKVSKTPIGKNKSTEDEDHRSYSNLLYSETSDIFKKEFNDFLTSAKAETIKSICSKAKSSARFQRKSGRHDIVISPLSSYKRSSENVRSKLQKPTEPVAISPWKLSTDDQRNRQLKDLKLSTLKKIDFEKMSKKQLVLHSKPFVKFRKSDRNAFQWREHQ